MKTLRKARIHEAVPAWVRQAKTKRKRHSKPIMPEIESSSAAC